MKHLGETFAFHPAVYTVAMNFNSSIIFCLSCIDIFQPIECHGLDLFSAFSFRELHGNAIEHVFILLVYNSDGCIKVYPQVGCMSSSSTNMFHRKHIKMLDKFPKSVPEHYLTLDSHLLRVWAALIFCYNNRCSNY